MLAVGRVRVVEVGQLGSRRPCQGYSTASFAHPWIACLRSSNCFVRVSRHMLKCLFLLIVGEVIRMSSITGSDAEVRNWRKSRQSMANGNCVEVASIAPTDVVVRDSTKPADLVLAYPAAVWRSFVAGVKSGKFDGSC
jgi:hypothetical protein